MKDYFLASRTYYLEVEKLLLGVVENLVGIYGIMDTVLIVMGNGEVVWEEEYWMRVVMGFKNFPNLKGRARRMKGELERIFRGMGKSDC